MLVAGREGTKKKGRKRKVLGLKESYKWEERLDLSHKLIEGTGKSPAKQQNLPEKGGEVTLKFCIGQGGGNEMKEILVIG